MQTISKKELDKYPIVALVGRVNVGKSTLFNLLIGEKKALTAPIPGTTRDINYGFSEWRGKKFIVADSGGFVAKPKTEIEKKVARQMEGVLKKANVVLFVVDIKEGMNPDDVVFLKLIRKLTKSKILLVANKADSAKLGQEVYSKEWLKLGLGVPLPSSATSGSGTGDMLDELVKVLPKIEEDDIDGKAPIRVAIIGRTNVGKSSILNQILGEDRVIVSDMEHTTREPQDMLIQYGDQPIILVDTVGIRKKTRVKMGIEREGVMRSIRNIKKADIVLLVIESHLTPSKQELRLARLADEAGAGIGIIVNKWDLIEEKQPKSILAFEDYFRDFFAFIAWAPLMFISALTGKRISKVLDLVMTINENHNREIAKEDAEVFIKKAIAKLKPQWRLGYKKPVIYGFEQEKTAPPTFALRVKDPMAIDYSYLRYLENRLRELYNFEGTPVRIHTEEVVRRYKNLVE